MERQPPKKPSTGKPAKARRGNVRPFERPRGGSAKAVGDLMPQVGRTAFRRYGFVQSSIVTRWPEIVGPEHAKVCAPESIRFPPGERSEGILQMVVAPAHAPLIQHVIPEIIERVNRFFGYRAIARVKMRQGPVQQRAVEPQRSTRPPELKPISMELGESLRDIGDPELRAVLEGLARTMGDEPGGDENEGTKQ
tara:strand:+ start:268 stop:849 length:582 start_codon:yes stop_codon:yes gene_type:complete